MNFARFVSPPRAIAAIQLGACSHRRPVTASIGRISSSWLTGTPQIPQRSTRTAAEPSNFLLKNKPVGEKKVASLPSLKILQELYRKAVYNAVRGSPLVSAQRTQRPFPHRQRVVRAEQSLPGERAMRSGELPHQWLIWLLAGLNSIVFLGWLYASHAAERYKDPRALFAMYENFTSSLYNLQQGRIWTLLTCCVSHMDLGHFALNMISFMFMGPPILALIGPTMFASLYFGSGVITSLISLGWRKYANPWINRDHWNKEQQAADKRIWSLGASGSIYAILTTFACVNPRQIFLLFFVLPVPAWICVPGIFAYDLYSAWNRPNRRTDSAGHVGGILAGLAFWRFRLRGFRLS